MEAFKEASQIDPHIKVCHLNQVLALYLNKEYTKAVSKFEEIAELPNFGGRYRREITWLEQDLEKEENDEIRERIKFKLQGFYQVLVMLYKRNSQKAS